MLKQATNEIFRGGIGTCKISIDGITFVAI